jgi:hypothetical protein
MIWETTDSIKKITETLIHACKEVCQEINVDKTKYMMLSHQRNAGQNHDLEIANRSFEKLHSSNICKQQ